MATKAAAKTTPKDNEKPESGAPEATNDSPLLDLSDAAVKKLIKVAKKRGYVTYEELNAVLPSEEVVADQIEDMGRPQGERVISRSVDDHWILLDFVNVVIHVFSPEARQFYDLEALWGEAKRVEWKA